MKRLRILITVLASINFVGAVIYFIYMMATMNDGTQLWVIYVPLIVSLIINGLVFTFVGDLGDRLDDVEKILKEKGLVESKEKDYPLVTSESKTVFNAGEPIKLKNEIVIGWKKFKSDITGMVIEVKENNIYVVEFDKDRGNKYEISGENLKSYFDK